MAETIGGERQGEETFREDERQACWEDFIQVLRTWKYRGLTPKSLLGTMLDEGWKDLGTGDGKPVHRLETSEVNKWLRQHEAKRTERDSHER